MNHYIAIDIGASSGRLMLSSVGPDKRIKLEEIHRFKNGFSKVGKYDCWNINQLTEDILAGLAKVKARGITKCSAGIDTWAVDYCLVKADGSLVAPPVAYRDPRTEKAISAFTKKMSLAKLYEKTGIQIQPFNTVFQLLVEEREKLAEAESLLLIPDYLGFVLTGKKVMEKTNASTTQLLNPYTQTWDKELLQIIGVNQELLPKLVEAGTILGDLQVEKFPTYDLPDVTLINVASHDTASAIIGTPAQNENWAYISSGTWSLLGIEATTPNLSSAAFAANYTNEWGTGGTIRFLKNIMGMWLIQEVARHDNYRQSYAEIAESAAKLPAFQQMIDVNDPVFLNPENMTTALQTYCKKTDQKVPETIAEIARAIYDNLALCYALELEKLSELTGREIDCLHIVGGGANNHFLNQLTADVAQIKVLAGPGEATALGNLMLQMIVQGEFADIKTARQALSQSIDLVEFKPGSLTPGIIETYKTFLKGRE